MKKILTLILSVGLSFWVANVWAVGEIIVIGSTPNSVVLGMVMICFLSFFVSFVPLLDTVANYYWGSESFEGFQSSACERFTNWEMITFLYGVTTVLSFILLISSLVRREAEEIPYSLLLIAVSFVSFLICKKQGFITHFKLLILLALLYLFGLFHILH